MVHKVLAVDQSPGYLDRIEKWIDATDGYSLDCTRSSINDGIAAHRKLSVDIFVADVTAKRSGDKTLWQAAKELKSDREGDSLRIIALDPTDLHYPAGRVTPAVDVSVEKDEILGSSDFTRLLDEATSTSPTGCRATFIHRDGIKEHTTPYGAAMTDNNELEILVSGENTPDWARTRGTELVVGQDGSCIAAFEADEYAEGLISGAEVCGYRKR